MSGIGTDNDPFSGVITARDVYGAVREIQAEVRSAVARMDRIEQAQEALRSEQERHRVRLDAIDRWRYALPISSFSAVAAALAAIITAVAG
ncbi:hypothetical protein RIF23_05175 [Lipingzhangella sp. LS1_29]|uniref:Uncharacterized protein n=1 Tax=Lipingzhangella rawalii TaxID=2055835 RepID=A0ABU2H306_9ACTN|nr:hypothetical protein [Lipingzhangella rawalii]MDS1269681.1 hypothetical protein [Lipingzhangella rawalii]